MMYTMAALPENILLIDKPKGLTSFDVIRELRRRLKERKNGYAPEKLKLGHAQKKLKLGHAGTLDPIASGLLIVGVGEGTKKLGAYLKLPKTYEAALQLGTKTDTGDLEGEVMTSSDASHITKQEIEKALQEMTGELVLPVSPYSAVKRGGEPLYKKARRGEYVEPPMRRMQVANAKLYDISYTPDGQPVAHVCLTVGSGTYIRSLAEELGRRLGTSAAVKELRRTKIGEFSVAEAKRLGEIGGIEMSGGI